MVTEEQAEDLAFAAVSKYMNDCCIMSVDEAKKAAEKMVAAAVSMLETVSDPAVQVQRLQ
jgi:hypothetical protein